MVVIADGVPVLWAAPRLKSLLAFSGDEKLLEAAVAALVASVRAALKREGASAARRKIVVEHFNGRDVLATPAASWLPDGRAGRRRAPPRRPAPLYEPVLEWPRRKKKGRCVSLRRGGPAIPAAVPLMIRGRSELAQGKESGRRPERRTAAPRVPGALRQVPA